MIVVSKTSSVKMSGAKVHRQVNMEKPEDRRGDWGLVWSYLWFCRMEPPEVRCVAPVVKGLEGDRNE